MFRIFRPCACTKALIKQKKMVSNIDNILNLKNKNKKTFCKKTFFAYKKFHLQVKFLSEIEFKIDPLLCTFYYYG